jgi:hypothetical protein
MLEARHLVKRFFGTAVVSDVSFEVRAGEVVGAHGCRERGSSIRNASRMGSSSVAACWAAIGAARETTNQARRIVRITPSNERAYARSRTCIVRRRSSVAFASSGTGGVPRCLNETCRQCGRVDDSVGAGSTLFCMFAVSAACAQRRGPSVREFVKVARSLTPDETDGVLSAARTAIAGKHGRLISASDEAAGLREWNSPSARTDACSFFAGPAEFKAASSVAMERARRGRARSSALRI